MSGIIRVVLFAGGAIVMLGTFGDFYASRSGRWVATDPHTWDDPMRSERNRFFADETDYFREWNGDPSVGPIRFIRKLGIHPLGTHSPSVAKDSLALAPDEWSGGFPCVYFTHSLPAAAQPGPAFGKLRFFDIERASYDAPKDRWFSQIVLDAPKTAYGVATLDGVRGHFIFGQYQHGMRRGGAGDWVPGIGPLANKPGGRSRIPGVMRRYPRPGEADFALYPHPEALVGWPLFGRGPLGLTSILHACHGKGLPYGEVRECLFENPTLFDYRADGRPRAMAVNAYIQTGSVDAAGAYKGMVPGPLYLPTGAAKLIPTHHLTPSADGEPMLKPGYWVFRFDDRRPEAGWQLDPNSRHDIGLHALNYVHGSGSKLLHSNWHESSILVYDAATRRTKRLLKLRAQPHVGVGEPSGTESVFVFLACRWPYFGRAVGLDDGVFIHDIYLASAYPIGFRNGKLVEPEVVKAYRDVLKRDPDVAGAFRDTARLRSGTPIARIRQELRSRKARGEKRATSGSRRMGRAHLVTAPSDHPGLQVGEERRRLSASQGP